MIFIFLSRNKVLDPSVSLRLQILPHTRPLRLCLQGGAVYLPFSPWTLYPGPLLSVVLYVVVLQVSFLSLQVRVGLGPLW